MFPRKIRRLVKVSLLLVLLFLSLILLLNFLIQRPSVQKDLIARLSEAAGFHIRTRKIVLNLWRGVGVYVYDLEAASGSGSERISASKVRVILDVTELLKGRIVPTRLYLIRPRLELPPPVAPSPSESGEMPSKKGPAPFWVPGLESISVDDGRVDFRKSPLGLKNVFLDAHLVRSGPAEVMLRGRGLIRYREEGVHFRIAGPISRDSEGRRLPSVAVTLETGRIPLNWIPWPRSLPVRQGSFETRLRVEGNLENPLSVDGRIMVHSPQFSIVSGERETGYSLSGISLDFKSTVDRDRVSVPSLALKTSKMALSIALDLDLKDRADPTLKLRAEGPYMDLKTFKEYFPLSLLPQWLEDRLFPVLEEGEVRLKHLSFDGTIEQISNLELPENQSVFTMGVGCRHFKVFGQGIELPFREVIADVLLEKGDFRISGLDATFGRSEIRGSGLSVLGIAGESPVFEALVDGSFDLEDLMLQRGMDIIPPDVLQKLRRVGPLSGNLKCRAMIRYEQEWPFPRTRKGEFLFRDVLVEQPDLRYPLSLEKAEFIVHESGENRFAARGAWGRSPFQAKGIFGEAEEKFSLHWANVSAEMDMNEVLSLLYRGEHFPLTFGNPLPSQLYITRVGDQWSCQGSIDLEGVILETNRFIMDPPGQADKIFFDLDFSPPGRIALKEILGQFGDSTLKLVGAYNLKGEDEFSFDLSAPSLSMEELGIRFYHGGRPAKGVLDCRLSLNVFSRNPLETTVTGKAAGKNLFLDLARFPSPVQGCNFNWDFSGRKVSIPSWTMQIGRTPLHIRGELEGWDGISGTVTADADFLDVRDLRSGDGQTRSGDRERGLDRFLEKSQVHLSLNFLRSLWNGIRVGPLKAEVDLMGKEIYLRRVSARMDRGLVNLAGHVRSGKKPEISISSHIECADQPLGALFESLGLDEYLEGSLTMEAYVFMKGSKKEALVPGMSGSANILVKEGSLKESHTFLKILDFLSLQKIFKKRPPELSKEGFYFESMGGHFEIDEGIMRTENGILKSPVLNTVASGEVDLTKRTVSLNLGVQPLETVDTLVSKVPILGHILTGKDKVLLTYYFTAKGPLLEPQVTYVPFKNLGSGVAGVLKRLLLAPVKLFKDLAQASDPGPDQETEGEEDRENRRP